MVAWRTKTPPDGIPPPSFSARDVDPRWSDLLVKAAGRSGAVDPTSSLAPPNLPSPFEADALMYLGRLHAADLPALAAEWSDGGEVPALVELAGVAKTGTWAILRLWERAKAELSIEPSMSNGQALEVAMRFELRQWRCGGRSINETAERVLGLGRLGGGPGRLPEYLELKAAARLALEPEFDDTAAGVEPALDALEARLSL